MEDREYSLGDLESEHEKRAHRFLAELKPHAEEHFPGMLRYAFDKSAEDIAYWDEQVRSMEKNLADAKDIDLDHIFKGRELLNEARAIAHEKEVASASQTEIAIGLKFDQQSSDSVSAKDSLISWLSEKAEQQDGVLESNLVVDRDGLVPFDVQTLVYRFAAKDS